MKTILTHTYTLAELKEQFPDGYARALRNWQNEPREIAWQGEIIDSLKAVLKAANVTLRDWSLGAYNRGNFISISFPQDDTADLHGKRAIAWLENNLFASLRVRGNMRIDDWRKYRDPETGYLSRNARLDNTARFYRTLDGKLHKRDGRVGEVPSCPLTGYCADEDYFDALRASVRRGDTLKEVFEGLADTCAKLLEQEAEYQSSEEYFTEHAEANDFQFTEDGETI